MQNLGDKLKCKTTLFKGSNEKLLQCYLCNIMFKEFSLIRSCYGRGHFRGNKYINKWIANGKCIINLSNVRSKVENNIVGCLLDSRGILATMYIKNGDKEQRKASGM